MDDTVFMCRKLVRMLEQEQEELAIALEGEIYDEYRKYLEQEKNSLQNIESKLRRI